MKDPICGMAIEPGKEHSRIKYKDKEYLFCSEACRSIFCKLNGLAVSDNKVAGDIERKMAAYNTLKQLAATVAHYIRNANAVIAAQAQLLSQPSDQAAIQKSVSLIRQQSDKIESIVNALLSISEIKLQKYTESDEEAIFDLRLALEEKTRGDNT